MKKNQSTKTRFGVTLTALLTASVLAATALTGCGGKQELGEKSIVTETQEVTMVANGVYVDANGNAITDPNGNPIPATTGDAASQASKAQSTAQSKAESKAQSKTESKAESKAASQAASKTESKAQSSAAAQSSASDGARKTTPSGAKDSTATKSTTKEDSAAKELTIGGKSYKVGDKIKCTYFLMVPDTMLNFQGRVVYDNQMLKKTGAHLVAPASYNALLNPDLDGRVVFNGSNLNGYDFTSPGYEFLVVEYEVLKTGATDPALTFEVITDTGDKVYCNSDGALNNGAKAWAVYE